LFLLLIWKTRQSVKNTFGQEFYGCCCYWVVV